MPRAPRPASTSTTTAPIRQQAYRHTVRSRPGGISSATRSPLATPCSTRPAATRRTSASSAAKLSDAPDPVLGHLDHRKIGVAGAPVEPGPRRSPRCRRRGVSVTRAVQLCDPLVHRSGDVCVLGHEVARADEPVDIGVRAGAPRDHAGRGRRAPDPMVPTGAARGSLAGSATPATIRSMRLGAGVRRIEGDVLHERADAGAPFGRPVRHVIRVANRLGQPRSRQLERGLDECRRLHAHKWQHARQPGHADQRRRPRARGLVHGGVGQDHAVELRPMPRRPSERDRDHPSRGPR